MKMFELISWFQLEYPELVSQMKGANHHHTFEDCDFYESRAGKGSRAFNLNPYHLESDIWTHTMMVCKQAENMPYEVRLAALLHDIGKPATRAVNPKNGRVSFFNHDAVSAFMSLEILKREELGLSEEQIIKVFNLIALHTQVYKLKDANLLNTYVPLGIGEEAYLLGKADHEGRFHSHEGAEISTILTGGVSSTLRSRETSKEVVILVGLPGAGKSTWMVQNMEKSEQSFVVTRDGIITGMSPELDYNEAWKSVDQGKVNNILQKEFKEATKYSKVMVDMTHMSKKSRRKSLSHFGPEYKRKCVIFLKALPTVFRQNEQREGKVIDKSVIERMMRSFYPPSFEEFDEIEYIL